MDHVGHDLGPILVTGAAGYLGGHVLANLRDKGTPCIAVTHKDCDLTDVGAVHALLNRIRPAVIIHCAALVPKTSSAYDDIQFADASVAMVKAIIRNTACPVVFASSMTVYTGVKKYPVCEDDAASPRSGYAHGKWLAEQILFERNVKGDVAMRLPGLFGLPRRSGLLYNAAKMFLSYGTFEADNSSVIWAAMDVRDAAEYMVRAALAASFGHPPQPVNVGYEGKFSVQAAVAEIAAHCGLIWEPQFIGAQAFSMCLSRLNQRYGGLPVTFSQRLKELIDVARYDLQAEKASLLNA